MLVHGVDKFDVVVEVHPEDTEDRGDEEDDGANLDHIWQKVKNGLNQNFHLFRGLHKFHNSEGSECPRNCWQFFVDQLNSHYRASQNHVRDD